MLWYLADGSLNDYLKSQVVLQGQYYSGGEASISQAKFANNTGTLTLENLTLSNIKNIAQNDVMVIDQVIVQLAPVKATSVPQRSHNDISKNIQHITVEKVTINKLRFNLTEGLTQQLTEDLAENFPQKSTHNKLNNLIRLQQRISQKLAADYPALYPDIAAKNYAKQHPELNAALVNNEPKNTKQKAATEINQAVIESKSAKHKKRLLGKATTRITILAFTVKSLEIKHIAKDGSNQVKHFSNIELPVIGQEYGLASNQIGGEILRLLLQTANQLQ